MKKATTYSIIIVFVIGLIFGSYLANSQDYKYHSLFIYNFTKYIEWPESRKSGDFIISVLGKSDITESLNQMAENKLVGSQKIKVEVVSDLSDIGKSHILFIPQNESGKLDQALSQINQSSILIITERPGMAKRGSAINFILEGGRWRFELNLSSIEKANLKISGELVKLGKVIQ